MIFELLREGKDNAITGRQICEILGIKSRDVTATVEQERRQGKPICASTGDNPGYYIADTREEMERYCLQLQHRAQEIMRTREACLCTLDDLPSEG